MLFLMSLVGSSERSSLDCNLSLGSCCSLSVWSGCERTLALFSKALSKSPLIHHCTEEQHAARTPLRHSTTRTRHRQTRCVCACVLEMQASNYCILQHFHHVFNHSLIDVSLCVLLPHTVQYVLLSLRASCWVQFPQNTHNILTHYTNLGTQVKIVSSFHLNVVPNLCNNIC